MNSIPPEQLLNDPLRNKGTAFTKEEREKHGLDGLLPYHISTLEQQLQRRYHNFLEKQTPLTKYIYLSNLQNRNEILFYRLLYEHISEMVPLIYTPTVGDVSLEFSILYRKNRGIYLSYPLKEKMEAILDAQTKEIDVVVVTDGERILGLGDVGIGGMAISQGKLILYTLFGGIHPARVLPVVLDVGTNNQTLLNDPLYLGWRHPRVTGKEYDAFVDTFVHALKRRFPRILLQWEDFAKSHARPLLDRYRNTLCCFNDDIQGTAAVVLSAILSGLKLTDATLKEQKIAILGGGSAGLGIAQMLFEAMLLEGATPKEAAARFYIIDIDGLIHTHLASNDPRLNGFARPYEEVSSWASEGKKITLLDVVIHAQPTILIGVCAQPHLFTETIVKKMASYTHRPIILPLSNPTSRSEATPEDLIKWTEGRAVIATGSPFSPVIYEGKTYSISQCNNVYIFPGVGLGVLVSAMPHISDRVFIRAAQLLSEHSPMLSDPSGGLFPDLESLRSVSRTIAIALVHLAQEEGLCPKTTQQEIEKCVDAKIWFPEYSD